MSSVRLEAQHCRACRRALAPAAAFCPACGQIVNRDADRRRVAATTLIGFFTLALLTVAGWSMVRPVEVTPSYGPGANGPSAETIDLGAVDPRAIADNLFNHVVDAAAAGDSLQMATFLELAVQAYTEVEPLDADARFHLSTLFRIGGAPEDALRTAEAILGDAPDHLLGLGAAAAAARDLGRDDEATRYYRLLVTTYDAQVDQPRPEYVGHATFLTRSRTDALAYLERR